MRDTHVRLQGSSSHHEAGAATTTPSTVGPSVQSYSTTKPPGAPPTWRPLYERGLEKTPCYFCDHLVRTTSLAGESRLDELQSHYVGEPGKKHCSHWKDNEIERVNGDVPPEKMEAIGEFIMERNPELADVGFEYFQFQRKVKGWIKAWWDSLLPEKRAGYPGHRGSR
ncbi:hypothetical protein EXIGLDRAFT_205930 [Exidia glandulosa HHB12029]|uniref:Uncharacterized protein n=1 Tax=Exidia glandulosa HHB12029 TaxID=1314781 RepID=A0A165MVY6_EXIGL|nr:hypothetical protein EXIGLDRAFT_205930 [Exidia glandulosa HHB12029]